MRPKAKNYSELKGHEEECRALVSHLEKHWEGVKNVKPKGYDKLAKNYTDFDGIDEWEENKKVSQEKTFKAFNDSTAGDFNFVDKVSLPHVVYNDLDQGRSPLMTLVGACVSYGFMRGELYGKHEEMPKREMIVSLLEAVLNIIK